jgi:hypothetical protein
MAAYINSNTNPEEDKGKLSYVAGVVIEHTYVSFWRRVLDGSSSSFFHSCC